MTRSDSTKAALVAVKGGKYLVYSVVGSTAGGRGGRGAGGGGGGGGGRGGRGGAGVTGTFEVFDLATNAPKRFAGRSVAVARDGGALVYLNGSDVMRLALSPLGEPQVMHRTTFQVQAPAISPNGQRVAFQQMPREDWEIMTIGVGDSVARQLTREIQHDLSPTFLHDNLIFSLIGEARHRRSYLHTVNTGTRTRFFHNNSVRTIAPEYEWAPSVNGTKVLIVAERDGDTVTPHRFLYCVDIGRPVTRAALVARVDSALAAERSLRAFATKSYTPIDAAVKAATAEVDVSRVYEYAETLHSFGTKFWSQPGNKLARDYLLSLYKSFGYANAKFMPFNPPARGGGGGGRGGGDAADTTAGAGGRAAGGGGRGGRGAAAPPGPIQTANVIAVLPGTENPELVYVVGSHFDSVQPGPGADDNTSGTTALLEAARVLANRPQPTTIVFVSFTGEEGGLLGSREFVRQVRDSLKIVGALNNDMIGFRNDQRLDNTIRYSNAGIKEIQHAAAIKYSNLITYDAFYYKSTDAAAFYDQYGDIVGGIGSYPVLGNPHYHQSHDVLETIDQQLVAEVSKTTVATLMMLASSPSRLAGLEAARTGSTANVKWTPSPEKGVARYIVRYGPHNGTKKTVTSTTASTTLTDAPAGTVIEVKAVNRRGLEGWDWARVTVK